MKQTWLAEKSGKNLKTKKINDGKKESKEKSIEVLLWEAASKLRGSVEPAETIFDLWTQKREKIDNK